MPVPAVERKLAAIFATDIAGYSPVSLGCCAAFVTPVSSAVNMLVMEPGGYSFGDYVNVGLPLLLLTMVVTVLLAALIYPLGGF